MTNVIISPNNQNFKYLDESHQIIVGKSDKSKGKFDVLIFASRTIEKVEIPPYIKRIESYAFQSCTKLFKIEIPENSELQSIGKSAFEHSKIEDIYLPASLSDLDEGLVSRSSVFENSKNIAKQCKLQICRQ